MKPRRLGTTGLRVSPLCLGTMTFGHQCDETTSRAILDRAVEHGITFLDTADCYPIGIDEGSVTEEIIGRWMRGRRDDVILGTKCGVPMGPNPWSGGASRKHILSAIDASLRRLGTDHVDLYQLHHPDRNTPMDETLAALDTIVTSGRAHYIGCSNWLAYKVALALGRSDVLRITRFASVQPRYNLLFRQIERELLPLCQEEGLAVLPYNPLAGGLLTGKHRIDQVQEGRFTLSAGVGRYYSESYWNERTFATVTELSKLAAESGISLATMAVGWVLANPAVTAPIIGASSPQQLDDAVAAVMTPLDPDLVVRLDELTTDYRFGDAAR